MKEGFYNIIRGNFLVSEDAPKNWRFIIFLSGLALIMVASSHSVDRKVRLMSVLNAEVKEMKSEYVDMRIQFMQSKLESRIISTMENKGLVPSSTPPKRILVIHREIDEIQPDTRLAKRD